MALLSPHDAKKSIEKMFAKEKSPALDKCPPSNIPGIASNMTENVNKEYASEEEQRSRNALDFWKCPRVLLIFQAFSLHPCCKWASQSRMICPHSLWFAGWKEQSMSFKGNEKSMERILQVFLNKKTGRNSRPTRAKVKQFVTDQQSKATVTGRCQLKAIPLPTWK